jgi:anaerobic ribonucleoside-triphosphate reductase
MKVKKRNGNIVDFDKNKIIVAIMKAMQEVGEVNKELALSIANKVADSSYDNITIDEIQNMV